MTQFHTQRPSFFEGQYLSASDLELALEYNRLRTARQALGHHTWGIATGLQLKEVPTTGGAVDVYIQPGFAIDGYGRHIVVASPVALTATYFEDIPPVGNTLRPVVAFIRFEARPTGVPGPNEKECFEDDDRFARLQEGFELQTFALNGYGHSNLHDPIVVAGQSIDALDAPPSREEGDPIICDESIPYQTFPLTEEDPNRRWLVPLGVVRLDQINRTLKPSEESDKRLARRLRKYIGAVVEDVFAADGVIRLRRREANAPEGGTSVESVCEGRRIRDDDLVEGGVPLDLAWIEGNLRLLGDAKIVNGEVDFRVTPQTSDHFSVRRRSKLNETELQLVIGNGAAGNNRLAVGPISADAENLEERFVVLDNGNVGVGTPAPDQAVTIERSGGAFLKIKASGGAQEALIGADEDGVTIRANQDLLLRAGNNAAKVTLKADGKVGIATDDPQAPLHVIGTNDVSLVEGSGLLVLGNAGRLNLGMDNNEIQARNGGNNSTLFLQADGGDLNVHFHRSPAEKFIVKASGRVGIGTDVPATNLDVRGNIALGGSGQYRAAAGHGDLLVVAGRVAATGTSSGSGYSASKHSPPFPPGVYLVTYAEPFGPLPAVTVTSIETETLATVNAGTGSFIVSFKDTKGKPTDTAFSFIAAGLRSS